MGPREKRLISQDRVEYRHAKLPEKGLPDAPFELFLQWFAEAKASLIREPHAMVLATVGARGVPSSRVVLMKDFSPRGVTFFTNLESRKGCEIRRNSSVALLFFWAELERQVRIEGRAERLSRGVVERYFESRPRDAQLGAWASPQSRVIADREEIEHRFEEVKAQFSAVRRVPTPPHWGGFRVVIQRIEFWQGREHRLHDRIVYVHSGQQWRRSRLAP